MKRTTVRVGLGIALVVLAAGCTSVDGVVSDALGAAVTGTTEQALERSVSRWTDQTAFQMTYMQVFFLGGYGAGFDDFEEGQGATWEITSTDGEEDSSFIGERALLRRNEDGTSWWYLRFDSQEEEDEEFEYEVLVDEEYTALEIYLEDPETGEIRHREFEQDPEGADAADGDEEWEEPTYDDEEILFDEDMSEYRRERVTVTVEAGTYETDLLVYEYSEEETGDSVEYRWWTTEEVPGDVVLYEWEDTAEAESGMLRGELIEVRSGYTTKFGAY
ncbi:MAG: hypothetical protein ACLFPO_07560 [Spirochaetaceae bacterium]